MFAQIIFKHGRPVFGYSAGMLSNWSWSSKLTGLLICCLAQGSATMLLNGREAVFFQQIDSLLDSNLGTD